MLVWMDAHCEELLRIAGRIEELSRLINVDKSQQAREGGQWVELPREEDEPFDSDNYYIRRFALKVVNIYTDALEQNRPFSAVTKIVLQLQKPFNSRYEAYLRNGVDFKTEFLKYLRLCGGDRCLRRMGGFFDVWTQNLAVNQAQNPDSVDEVEEFNSEEA